MIHCIRYGITAAALLILSSATIAMGASLTISAPAGGTYTVQGDGLSNVGGIELSMTYDTSSLASPTVTQGSLASGAMMAANTANPGSIKVAIITSKTISGSGPLVSVTFATQSGSGGITSFSANMIDSKGAQLPVQASFTPTSGSGSTGSGLISTAGIPFSQPGTAITTGTTTTPTGTTSSPIMTSLGTVSMPADSQPKSEAKPTVSKQPDTTLATAQTPEPEVSKPSAPPAVEKPAPELQKPEKVKFTSYKGTLENFREYNGDISPANLIAIFNKQIAPAISQEPPVAMSDGKTRLLVRVKLEVASDKSPNFALNGAKLVSLNLDTSSTWLIEALPQAGSLQASLTILTEGDIIEYPLTLAPAIEDFSTTDADFAVFLADSGAAAPKRDLNRDGRHDYLDNFIYTANYLARKAAADKTKK